MPGVPRGAKLHQSTPGGGERNAGEWEIVTEAEVDARPGQVWQALTTAPGLDGWFSGSCEISPGAGGTLRSTLAGHPDELAVAVWEPEQRVTFRSPQGDDGRFYALEWQVEGRRGKTVLRCVASGFIPGEDWEAEFDSLRDGGAMYFHSLVQYLTYFRGRTALVVDALGPPPADGRHSWQVMQAALGLHGTVNAGDQLRLTPAGLAPIEGVVYAASPHLLAVRTSDALYRFLGVGPMGLASHRIFAADLDRQAAAQAWQAWLSQVLA